MNKLEKDMPGNTVFKRLTMLAKACAVTLLLIASVQVVTAQQKPVAAPAPSAPSPAPASVAAPALTNPDALVKPNAASSPSPTPAAKADERYRLGPGDVLDIRVYNRPQLSREDVRIDGRGVIRMPLIDGEIQAACRTESELAAEISSRYLKYYRTPHVDVFVKSYVSEPVAIIGAVNDAGRFQLQRRVRLLELLTFAKGPAERAGRSIQIVHAGAPSLCEAPASADSTDALATNFVTYSLSDTLRGDDKANPYVRAGDIISLPEADQIYVVGNVGSPRAIALKEPVTVSRAIAMSGGTLRDTKTDRVRIIRQNPGMTTKTEIYVNLKAIDKRQAEDVALQANDIVDVPTSSGKSLLRSLVGGVVPSVATLPVRVIP